MNNKNYHNKSIKMLLLAKLNLEMKINKIVKNFYFLRLFIEFNNNIYYMQLKLFSGRISFLSTFPLPFANNNINLIY